MQATILRVKLKHLKTWTDRRRKNARLYNECLQDIAEITTPPETIDGYHVYHLYIIRAQERDKLKQFLEESATYTMKIAVQISALVLLKT